MVTITLTDEEAMALKVLLEKARYIFSFDGSHAVTENYKQFCNEKATWCKYFLNKISDSYS